MENPEKYSKGHSGITINKVVFDKYKQLIKWGPNPESIIEAGIGDGKVSKAVILPIIPKNIKEYVGTDLSQNMLEFSKSLIDHPKYETAQVDICAKEIPNDFQNRFDKAFACFLLHMVGSKARQALTNLYKFLKPGGQLIYTAFERLPMGEAYEKLDKTKWFKFQHNKYLSPFYDSESPFEEYKKLTKEVGFKEDIITLLDDLHLYFPNDQNRRSVMEAVNMVLKNVPPEEFSEYLEDYLNYHKKSSTFSEDEKTGEQRMAIRLVVAIVTKPFN